MDNNNSPEKWNQDLQQWMQCLSLRLHGEPSAVLILHYLVHMQKRTQILSGETGNIVSSMEILFWQNNNFWHATYLIKYEKNVSCHADVNYFVLSDHMSCILAAASLQTLVGKRLKPKSRAIVACSLHIKKNPFWHFVSYSLANIPSWVNQRPRSHYLKIQTIRKHVCYMVKSCTLDE